MWTAKNDQWSGPSYAANPATPAFSSPLSNPSLIVVYASSQGADPPTPTDTAGNLYHDSGAGVITVTIGATVYHLAIFYAVNSSTTASNIVSLTTANLSLLEAAELTGLYLPSVVRGFSKTQGGSTGVGGGQNMTSGLTGSHVGDLVFGLAATASASDMTVGTNFSGTLLTPFAEVSTGGIGVTGNVAATWNASTNSESYSALAVAFTGTISLQSFHEDGAQTASPQTISPAGLSSIGNLSVLLVYIEDVTSGGAITLVKNNLGDTYTMHPTSATDGKGRVYLCYKTNASPGITSIIITYTNGPLGVGAWVLDCSSATGGVFDKIAVLNSQSGANPAPNINPSAAGIAAAIIGDVAAASAVASPFTTMGTETRFADFFSASFDMQQASGSITSTFTVASNPWCSLIASFVEAVAAALATVITEDHFYEFGVGDNFRVKFDPTMILEWRGTEIGKGAKSIQPPTAFFDIGEAKLDARGKSGRITPDWFRQHESGDTDARGIRGILPPSAIEDDTDFEFESFVPTFLQYDDSDSFNPITPPVVSANQGWDDIDAEFEIAPPFALYDHTQDMDEPGTAPPPPTVFSDNEDSQHWVGWMVPAVEDDQNNLLQAPPFAIQDGEIEKTYDQRTEYDHTADTDEPGSVPVPPFAIQDGEVEKTYDQHTVYDHTADTDEPGSTPKPPVVFADNEDLQKWSGWAAPAIEDDQSDRQVIPPVITPNIGMDDIETLFKFTSQIPLYDHTQDLDEPGALGAPPTAFTDDAEWMRWVDWKALALEDDQRNSAPTPPFSYEEEYKFLSGEIFKFNLVDESSANLITPPVVAPNIGLDDLDTFMRSQDRVIPFFEDIEQTKTPPPPKVFQDEISEAWKAWSQIYHDDLETRRSIPPPPPPAIQDEVSERWSDRIAIQYEDTETQRALLLRPPTAQTDQAEDSRWVDKRFIQHDDTDTQNTLPPTPPAIPPKSIAEEILENWFATRQVYHEDAETQRAFPPPPPFSYEEEYAYLSGQRSTFYLDDSTGEAMVPSDLFSRLIELLLASFAVVPLYDFSRGFEAFVAIYTRSGDYEADNPGLSSDMIPAPAEAIANLTLCGFEAMPALSIQTVTVEPLLGESEFERAGFPR